MEEVIIFLLQEMLSSKKKMIRYIAFVLAVIVFGSLVWFNVVLIMEQNDRIAKVVLCVILCLTLTGIGAFIHTVKQLIKTGKFDTVSES
ncbi:hypothetical protein KG089_00815 [Carnobacteriaceae bacterium zg-ZUI252]|nr:hypothetical protein [Carnobacteriaceae bacterium zg-ZUI252]QTU82505.1 hypothetical protein J7S27_04115 [Carnobacteriaceae bacterium zg-C25]